MSKKFSVIISLLLFFISVEIGYAIPIGPDKYYIDESNLGNEFSLNVYGKEDLDKEQELYFSVVGMKKVGNEHDREFYFVSPEDSNELANHIQLGKTSGTIRPGEVITIPWTIDTTSITKCGTHLAGIMVSNIAQSEMLKDSTINIQKEIISQIHLTINQDKSNCTNEVKLDSFGINQWFKIFNYDHVPFRTILNNSGDYLTKSPKGFIEIFGLGDKVTVEFNSENLDIYPKTERKFENIWIDSEYPHDGSFWDKLMYELTHFRFGRYEARLGVTKNVEQTIVAYDHFWIFPWRIIVVIIGIIASIKIIQKAIISKRSTQSKG